MFSRPPARPITTIVAFLLVCGMISYGVWMAQPQSVAIGLISGIIILPDMFRLVSFVVAKVMR
jgi:hypothetical protein